MPELIGPTAAALAKLAVTRDVLRRIRVLCEHQLAKIFPTVDAERIAADDCCEIVVSLCDSALKDSNPEQPK